MRDNSYIDHFRDRWEKGERYDLAWKQDEVMPVLEQLENEDKLGPVVADIGSGPLGVSRLLYGKDLKLIRVDIVAHDAQDDKVVQTGMDVDKLSAADIQTKRSLVKIRQWLEEQGIDTSKGPVVDTMILSEVVSYIDYQRTIPALIKYVKEGGRVVVFNMPARGDKEFFIEKDKRALGNVELALFLESQGLRMETLSFNSKYFDFETFSYDDLVEFDQTMMLYVGKKTSINTHSSSNV